MNFAARGFVRNCRFVSAARQRVSSFLKGECSQEKEISCKTHVCTQVKQQTLIPTALEAGSLRSRSGQILCPVGPVSWLVGDHLPSVTSPVGDTTLVSLQFSSVQLLSRARLSVTPWTAARQASLSITNSWSSPKLMSIESVMPSSHLILCCPLLPPSIFPSIRVFSNEAALCIRWPKYWSFSFNISEHPGLPMNTQD